MRDRQGRHNRLDKGATVNRQAGFALFWVALITAALPVAILAASHLVGLQRQFDHGSGLTLTKTIVQTAASRLKALAVDIDTDDSLEPLLPNGGDGLPLALGVASRDHWGTELRYCAWDRGDTQNAVDPVTYSANWEAAPAEPLVLMKLIAAGPDRSFQTGCAATAAAGDDLYLDIRLAEVQAAQVPVAGGSGFLDFAAEVSVTGAIALDGAAFGKNHVCSGTTGDYTVTLPAASGNGGKVIGFRMASGLTKLVTLDAGVGVTIDGTRTRVLWANESAWLLSDGTNWTKVAGKTIPMSFSTDGSGYTIDMSKNFWYRLRMFNTGTTLPGPIVGPPAWTSGNIGGPGWYPVVQRINPIDIQFTVQNTHIMPANAVVYLGLAAGAGFVNTPVVLSGMAARNWLGTDTAANFSPYYSLTWHNYVPSATNLTLVPLLYWTTTGGNTFQYITNSYVRFAATERPTW